MVTRTRAKTSRSRKAKRWNSTSNWKGSPERDLSKEDIRDTARRMTRPGFGLARVRPGKYMAVIIKSATHLFIIGAWHVFLRVIAPPVPRSLWGAVHPS